MNIEDQLRAYGSTLDQRPAGAVQVSELTDGRTRRSSKRRVLWGIGAAMTAIIVAIAVASMPPARRAVTPSTVTTVPSAHATTTLPIPPGDLPRHFKVRQHLAGDFAPRPIAASDGDVWLVAGQLSSGPGARIERRDANTGLLKATITIPGQEATFAITADGAGHIYIAGGGDGGVPRTTVSRISTATDHVDYSVTLPANARCSCLVAATAGEVWLSGNSSTTAIALDPASARVDAVVPLPAPSTVMSVAGSTIDIGTHDARVAVIDSATRRVAHIDRIGDNSAGLAGRIVAISPYSATGNSWNAWVTRGDGVNMILQPNGTTTQPAQLGLAPDATTTTATGTLLYFIAGNELGVRTRQHNTIGVTYYDSVTNSFGDVVASTTGAAAPSPGGFDDVLTVGSSVWVRLGDSPGGTVLLIRPQ